MSRSSTDLVDRAVLEGGDLKIVSTIAVGYNIDIAAARERNIIVTNTPDVLNESTADLTWSLILGVMRRNVEGDRLVRRGGWKGFALDFMLGSDSARQAARHHRIRTDRPGGWRARTGLWDACRLHRSWTKAGRRRRVHALDRLLSTSDVVSLHCPLRPRRSTRSIRRRWRG